VSRPRPFQIALWTVIALTFVVGLLRFDGPARGYWDTYITTPAMFMNQVPVHFVLRDGTPAFHPTLHGVLPNDLVDKDDFGIITKDQRLGGGVVASLSYAFFGQLGFRVLFAFTWMLLIPLGVLVFRQILPDRDWAGLLGAIAFAWNPFMLNVDRLNNNGFSLPLMLLVIYLLFRKDRPLVLTAIVFGVLAGIRNEAICFVPAITWWILRRDPERSSLRPFLRRFGRLFVFGVLTVLALSPILYWKWFAFGNPLMHPSQYAHFQGFRPEFPHHFFGWTFSFNGLFNWPFHTQLVRTPHFGYPTYLLFPLATARAFGLVGIAIIFYGVYVLARRRPAVLAFFLAWMAPVYILFGPQENWEEVKMTFMLLAWPPLLPFFAAGLVGLWEQPTWTKRLVPFGALLIVALVGIKGLGAVHAPQDMRWYVRFPNADLQKNPKAQAGLAEVDRNDALYFQSYETAAEIAQQRQKLSAALPWPAQYLPLDWDFGREWAEMKTEAHTRDLEVEEVWGYIYGTRRL